MVKQSAITDRQELLRWFNEGRTLDWIKDTYKQRGIHISKMGVDYWKRKFRKEGLISKSPIDKPKQESKISSRKTLDVLKNTPMDVIKDAVFEVWIEGFEAKKRVSELEKYKIGYENYKSLCEQQAEEKKKRAKEEQRYRWAIQQGLVNKPMITEGEIERKSDAPSPDKSIGIS